MTLPPPTFFICPIRPPWSKILDAALLLKAGCINCSLGLPPFYWDKLLSWVSPFYREGWVVSRALWQHSGETSHCWLPQGEGVSTHQVSEIVPQCYWLTSIYRMVTDEEYLKQCVPILDISLLKVSHLPLSLSLFVNAGKSRLTQGCMTYHSFLYLYALTLSTKRGTF